MVKKGDINKVERNKTIVIMIFSHGGIVMTKDIKQRIEITTTPNRIHFYVKSKEHGRLYLFSQKYYYCVYRYFRHGRSMSEIRSFRNWNNYRLEKTILRIPKMVKYVMKEVAEIKEDGWEGGYAA